MHSKPIWLVCPVYFKGHLERSVKVITGTYRGTRSATRNRANGAAAAPRAFCLERMRSLPRRNCSSGVRTLINNKKDIDGN